MQTNDSSFSGNADSISSLLPAAAETLESSEEAERAVLASVLLEPTAWPLVVQRLTPPDFALERHRLIYEAMCGIAGEGQPVDALTLKAKLEEQGTLDLAGGVAYIHCLDVELPDCTRVDTYAEIVQDRSLRRALAYLGTMLTRRAFDTGTRGAEVLAEAEVNLLRLGERLASQGLESVAAVAEATITYLEEGGEGSERLRTGFPSLDGILGGLGRGRMTVLAGRPGQGKTSVALTIAHHLARHQGHTVALFSLEMTKRELGLRILALETGIPIRRLESGILSRDQWSAVQECWGQLRPVPLYLDDSSGLTLPQLAGAVRRLKIRRGVDAVVVDYLQLLAPGEAHPNENLALSAMSRSLKKLANELDVTVMALSQLSRESERRGIGSRPVLSDLRGSGAIEQNADAVVFVWAPDPGIPSEEAVQLLVSKNRHGRPGEVDLRFQKETMLLSEAMEGKGGVA